MEDFEEFFKRGELFPELQPRSIARLERILPAGFSSSEPWSDVHLGVSLDQLLPVPFDSKVPGWAAASLINHLLVVHRNEHYVLGASTSTCTLQVVLKQGATPEDQLKAAFHAYLVGKHLDAAEDGSALELSALVRCISNVYLEANKSWPKFLGACMTCMSRTHRAEYDGLVLKLLF